MNPLLSIIIPVYNHKDHLPDLLTNIASQTFQDFEVILVDDCSDEPFDDVVSAWQNKSFNLHLYKNSSRQYTKNTRLNGIEHARGEFIIFIDADDLLAGTSALGHHIAMMREQDAELLHFQIASYKEGTKEIITRVFEWTKPFGEILYGSHIFEAYAAENLRAHGVAGKIATRSLWQKCLAHASASSVRRYREDLLLCSLLLFHAKSYLGSDLTGYTRTVQYKDKSIGQAASSYAMLTEFLPYIQHQGVNASTAQKVQDYLLTEVVKSVRFIEERVLPQYGYNIPDELLQEIEEHCPLETFVKILLAGFPLPYIQELQSMHSAALQIIQDKENSPTRTDSL